MLERLKLHSIFLAVTFLFLHTFTAQALEIPPPTTYRVNDFAGVLKAETKERIESKLRTFEKETTTQIVVAIFPSIEDESVEDFTVRLAEAWKVGQKENNNGALLAIYIKEHKARIEVGYGLEGALTDALSSRIIRNELAPDFRAENYDAGVEKTVDAIMKAVRGEYTAPEATKPRTSYFGLLVFFLIIMFMIFRAIRAPMTIGPGRRRRNGGWYGGSHWGGGSGWGGGGGWGGGSSGGGFSGGGGSFGGGGATGSW
jgi:uncharacterized protein